MPISTPGRARRLTKLRGLVVAGAPQTTSPQTPTGHHCFYRALAEGALDIITVVDEFGTIVYKSPSTEQHLGHRPEEFLGRNLFEFVHPDDIRACARHSRRLPHERHARRRPVELRVRHMDGLWRTLESVGRFQSDGAGGRIGIIHSRDVGARKLLEAQVRQAQKMEAVGLSTGAIAHDFNNMLVVIAGYTALLATDPSQTVREFAREMRMATDRATELTGQLLSFARASQMRRAGVRRQRGDRGLPADPRPHGRPRRARVATRSTPSPPRVPVGSSALDQVLINLVVNARDAMPAGGELTVDDHERMAPAPGDARPRRCRSREYVVHHGSPTRASA